MVSEQTSQKIAIQRKLISDLEEKAEYQELVIAELDERCNVLENDL